MSESSSSVSTNNSISKYEWVQYAILGALFIASVSILLYLAFRKKGGNRDCSPNCTGKVCGDDGCGGMCPPNSCPDKCVNGKCQNPPSDPCKGKCGNFDGNTCGECEKGFCDDTSHTCVSNKLCSSLCEENAKDKKHCKSICRDNKYGTATNACFVKQDGVCGAQKEASECKAPMVWCTK